VCNFSTRFFPRIMNWGTVELCQVHFIWDFFVQKRIWRSSSQISPGVHPSKELHDLVGLKPIRGTFPLKTWLNRQWCPVIHLQGNHMITYFRPEEFAFLIQSVEKNSSKRWLNTFCMFIGRLLFLITSQTLFLRANFYLIVFQLTNAFFTVLMSLFHTVVSAFST